MEDSISKLAVQRQLLKMLNSVLSRIEQVSEEIGTLVVESGGGSIIYQYRQTLRDMTDLIATAQQLMASIPDEVIANKYSEMTDEQLLRILNEG